MRKHLCLVANRMFQIWWPLECSMFGYLWKEKGKYFFHLPSLFIPKRLYLDFFSLIYRVLFYHGFLMLFCHFPSFSLTYKLHSCILMYQAFHTLIVKLILIKDFSFFWIPSVAHDDVLWASNHINEQIIALEGVPIWHWLNTLVMKISNHEKCTLLSKSNLLERGIIEFL